jgi:hypothetical protein
MKKLLLFLLICNSSIIFAQEKKETAKIQIVEASCGQCQFGMKENGCDLAVRIEGKSYFVKELQSILTAMPTPKMDFVPVLERQKLLEK